MKLFFTILLALFIFDWIKESCLQWLADEQRKHEEQKQSPRVKSFVERMKKYEEDNP